MKQIYRLISLSLVVLWSSFLAQATLMGPTETALAHSATQFIAYSSNHDTISGTKTVVPIDFVSANDVLTYTIVFSSDTDMNEAIIISDTVPDLTHYKPNSISSEPKSPTVLPTDTDKQTMFWTVPKLVSNTLISLTFAVIVNSPISNGLIITNQAYISNEVTNAQTNTVVSSPTLAIAQSGPTTAIVGDKLVYTIRYTNSGTMTATQVVITNSLIKGLDVVTSDTEFNGENNQIVWRRDTLPPGNGMIILTTTAKSTSTGVNQLSISSNEVVAIPPHDLAVTVTAPAITLTKIAQPSQAKVGDTVTYTYQITNIGEGTLTKLTLIDDKLGSMELETKTLSPQGSTSHTVTYQVKLTDAPAPLVNLATVSGQASANTTVTATARATVILIGDDATIALSKQADHITATIGDGIVYTYTVTNTSNIALLKITLQDDKISSFKPTIDSLAPSEVKVFTAVYTVTAKDLESANNLLINVANVLAQDMFGKLVAKTARAEVGLVKPIIPVYLPLIIKQPPPADTPTPTATNTPTATPIPMTTLYIQSENTGGISSVEILDSNNNQLLLQCGPIGNNVTVLCGQFKPVDTYTMIAITNKCGTLRGNFKDASPDGKITRKVFCR